MHLDDDVVAKCLEARKKYEAQKKLVYPFGGYNGRYQPKLDRLFKIWLEAETNVIKNMYEKAAK